MANKYRTQNDSCKTCPNCQIEKPMGDFGLRSANSHLYKSWCKLCEAEKRREAVRNKTAKLQAYKMDRGCVDCGYNKWPGALQFDHLPQFTKSFNIGTSAGSKTWEQLLEEISKCEIVCANCHAERTDKRRTLK